MKKYTKLYVIMRADHIKRELFPDKNEVAVCNGTDVNGEAIWTNTQAIRSIKIYKSYDKAIEERDRLQSLKDKSKVEYFVDAAYFEDGNT